MTDYDVGIPSATAMQPESMEAVLAIFRRNTVATVSLLERLADSSKEIAACNCATKRLAEYYKLANGESQ